MTLPTILDQAKKAVDELTKPDSEFRRLHVKHERGEVGCLEMEEAQRAVLKSFLTLTLTSALKDFTDGLEKSMEERTCEHIVKGKTCEEYF